VAPLKTNPTAAGGWLATLAPPTRAGLASALRLHCRGSFMDGRAKVGNGLAKRGRHGAEAFQFGDQPGVGRAQAQRVS